MWDTPYPMSISCGSTPLMRTQCNPSRLVPTLALLQNECTKLNGNLRRAIKYLKYFLQYKDKYTLLLLDPKDIIDIGGNL